jgi:hypothetical protein
MQAEPTSVLDHSLDDDFQELRASVATQRGSNLVDPKSTVFLCVAWSNVEETGLFKKYHDIIYCDATGDTNNTGNHLITFSGRTPEGKSFIFLRCWTHNQKQVTFRWIFKVALRTFLPDCLFDQVKLFLVDGDRQQLAELQDAIAFYLKDAMVGLCGFHLVNQNWKQNGISQKCVDGHLRQSYQSFVKTLHRWLYSFMRPGYCETEAEYHIRTLADRPCYLSYT